VYFCWGSTYTAIHIAGEYFSPPLVAAMRSLLSAVLMISICVGRGKSLRVSRGMAWRLALVGVLFMSVNNILLTWAETMIASGVASLVIAMIPIMIALIEAVMPGGEALNRRGWAGVLLGTAGMVALVWPSLHRDTTGGRRSLLAFGVLLVAGLAFSVGSVLARRFQFKGDAVVMTTWQIGCAGLVNLMVAGAAGSFRTAEWTRHGLMAVGYLSVVGSLIGLSAYTYLLQHVPVTKVSTYAFVNPLIAVLLGVVVLGERLQPAEMLGIATIVAAVAMVILSRVKREGAVVEDATEVEA
jgi:drug/metabolite transporter (DMT)-like permease